MPKQPRPKFVNASYDVANHASAGAAAGHRAEQLKHTQDRLRKKLRAKSAARSARDDSAKENVPSAQPPCAPSPLVKPGGAAEAIITLAALKHVDDIARDILAEHAAQTERAQA